MIGGHSSRQNTVVCEYVAESRNHFTEKWLSRLARVYLCHRSRVQSPLRTHFFVTHVTCYTVEWNENGQVRTHNG
jgi:hypothetical protein